MNQEKIGKFIAEQRNQKKMTQQELASLIGVTDRAVSKWENGRGLPDISLIQPLCKNLDITINELLSGEKIKKEELEEKFEENIINTMDYSKQKIKHTKFIFSFLMIIISLVLLTLAVLFIIDITRMRNNEPVFFSTWGFKYAPPVNLDDINIEKSLKNYLVDEMNQNKHYDNEQSFVAMRIYLITEDLSAKYYVYAWVLQEQYYEENRQIINDTSSSIPYKFELIKENDQFIVNNYEIPRDGSYYIKDMKHLFPNSVLKAMDSIHTDDTIPRLQMEISNEVNAYYNKAYEK